MMFPGLHWPGPEDKLNKAKKAKTSFLCKIGLHDWEVLDRIERQQLRANIIVERHLAKYRQEHPGDKTPRPGAAWVSVPYEQRRYLYKRVCLRCHKCYDQITPMIESIEYALSYKEIRRKTAEEICAQVSASNEDATG
jgi:hypothetical protein